MATFTMSNDNNEPQDNGKARFTVFGVGGGGGNAVEHMVKSGISGVTFVCANTDRQALDNLSAPHLLQLDAGTNRGLGAGADPSVGREAAEASTEEIKKHLEGADMVFITAGMGGGTGTGGAPVVARLAKEMGVLTVAVVTTPFTFEGKRRVQAAKEGIEELVQHVDSIISIPNDKILQVYGNINFQEAFKKADDVLLNAVSGIAETITNPGLINIDFNDIRTAMTSRGYAMMGIGRATGEDRARQATEMAMRSPLLDDVVLENAKGLLVNITSSSSFTPIELNIISEVVSQITDVDDASIFYGTVIDESLQDELRVTVIATGLTRDETPKAKAATSDVQDGTQHTSAFAQKQRNQTEVAAKPKKPERSGQSINVQQFLRQQQKK